MGCLAKLTIHLKQANGAQSAEQTISNKQTGR